MDFLYDACQQLIPPIAKTEVAEEKASAVYKAVEAYDRELADQMDTVMGLLARAYEMQGFFGGLAFCGMEAAV